MQPQAPANPAETLAKVPRMEAMEPTTWVYFGGQGMGQNGGATCYYRCIGTAARRSTGVGLSTYMQRSTAQHTVNGVRLQRRGCCF